MTYVLEPRGENSFNVLNDASDHHVGYVYLRDDGKWIVQNSESDDIAPAESLEAALTNIVIYYEFNPPQWKRESATRYSKDTQFGVLTVEQDHSGQWLAHRDNFPLISIGREALFATPEAAQHVADAHVRQGFPNSEMIFEGYAWLPDPDPWWSYPNRVAVRTNSPASI
jgi:hypothetical protein